MRQGVARISAVIVVCLCGVAALAAGPAFQPHVEAELVAETEAKLDAYNNQEDS